MSHLGLGHVLLLDFHKAKLQRIVAVLFSGFLLCDNARANLDDSNRNDIPFFIKNLCHADFLTDHTLFHDGFLL